MNLESLARALQQGAQGRRYFVGSRKGENYELRADLNSEYPDVRKDAVKRVIANMTVGKDVSGLFPDVLKNMQTDDIELKKLVYLYLINYSKTQPELVILAVNTFVKDTDDVNPLIRALSIRTMGCLRAERIVDYLCDPLRKCLRDENPYVRKTAAIAVVKLYDLKPDLCIEQGFVEILKDLIGDNNPTVVANAVAALSEIEENLPAVSSPKSDHLSFIDSSVLPKLLVALGECTEWGRIALLNAIAAYKTRDAREAETICERVIPQFQHANGSVVLAAIKVVMIHIRVVTREEFVRTTMRKMAPPLVTLVSSPPEIQWIALRNINLILQKRPDALTTEMRVFFCKYNDPPYVKVEKLDIMIKLASSRTVDMLLSELKEYASEVDVEFVRRAIKAIGQCAIKIEDAAGRCVELLLDLIATKVNYVVQEAIVVIKDIFRKYPNKYERVISQLCEALEDLDEPEAKASLIWILGEYASRIDNADELLSSFVDTFTEDPFQIQLQTLSAVVKLYINKPDEAQSLVQRVLSLATKNCDSPDIRDRAYIYWRLLSSDTELTKSVILAERPAITLPSTVVSPALLDELIAELGSLASAYFKPPEAFIGKGRLGADELQRKASEMNQDLSQEKALHTMVAGENAETLLDFDGDDDGNKGATTGTSGSFMNTTPTSPNSSQAATVNPLADLMGLFDSAAPPMPPSSSLSSNTSPPPPPFSSSTIAPNLASFSSSSSIPFSSSSSSSSPPPPSSLSSPLASSTAKPSSPLSTQTSGNNNNNNPLDMLDFGSLPTTTANTTTNTGNQSNKNNNSNDLLDGLF